MLTNQKYFNLKLLFKLTVMGITLVVIPDAVCAKPTNAQITSLEQAAIKDPNLLAQGKNFYNRGQYRAAVEVWEKARKQYRQTADLVNADRVNLVRTNNYLSTVYQDLGEWQQAEAAIADSSQLIAQLQPQITRRNSTNLVLLQAQTLNTKASWLYNQGDGRAAFVTWQETEQIYQTLNDATGMMIARLNQAQALQSLGYFRRGQDLLDAIAQQLQQMPDSPFKLASLNSLGAGLTRGGNLDLAQATLLKSLELANQLKATEQIATTYFQLGNIARSQANLAAAADYYKNAITQAANPNTQLQARLNLLGLHLETENLSVANELVAQIQAQVNQLPPSRNAVQAKVNFAQSLIQLQHPQSKQLLTATLQQAQQLEDAIATASVLETLGNWYEQNHNPQEALKLTNQALQLLATREKSILAASLHWQAGRILASQNQQQSAISAYRAATANIEHLQQDLIGGNSTNKLDFQQAIEPIYRQLTALLLQDIELLSPPQKQTRLQQSLETIEALKQKELENFFRIACLDVTEQNIAKIDRQAAVVYPILLPDSIEMIVSVPDQPLIHFRTAVDAATQTTTFKTLAQYLTPVFSKNAHLETAQKLYDWLIRPVESNLQQQQIETLVFVLDGNLRSLPMAVLHDGDRYIIEEYDLALTPGMQLLRNQSSQVTAENVVIGGISEPRQGFAALPGVTTEIASISQTLPAEILLNRQFTNPELQQQVSSQPISILHLATHGQFSSNAEDTFILTWSDRINVSEFDRLLNQRDSNTPIDLLVLSACQTAVGDNQAILGLAGMAVRSGAKSTVASLWSVSDRSTAELMERFYHYLQQPDTNKAKAIRQAQLSLLENSQFQHPYYWSPFILVGNWD